MLWLVMEKLCTKLQAAYVEFFSENSPTIGWVKCLAVRVSLVEMQLVRVLTLRLEKYGTSLLTPLHIFGEENSMRNIPSRLFDSNLAWFCKNYTDLLFFFNKNLPLPNQASWTVFSPSNASSMKVISVLRMQHFEMDEWLQLKKAGENVGKIGVPFSDLWEWSLGYRMESTRSELGASQALQLAYGWSAMVAGGKLLFSQSLGRSWTLA